MTDKEIMKLAEEYVFNEQQISFDRNTHWSRLDVENAFIAGFKKAQEMLFTEEQMEAAFNSGASNQVKERISENKLYPPIKTFKEFLSNLKQQSLTTQSEPK